MKKPDFLGIAATALGGEINGEDKVYTHKLEAAAKFTEDELEFIDKLTQQIFDQAEKDEIRPYVIAALCGSILSNLVRGSEDTLEVDAVIKFTELATVSQLGHECCDGDCYHDDCCGKVAENCPNYKTE